MLSVFFQMLLLALLLPRDSTDWLSKNATVVNNNNKQLVSFGQQKAKKHAHTHKDMHTFQMSAIVVAHCVREKVTEKHFSEQCHIHTLVATPTVASCWCAVVVVVVRKLAAVAKERLEASHKEITVNLQKKTGAVGDFYCNCC